MDTKVMGLAMWPFSHVTGLSTMPEPDTDTIKKTKPSYFVKYGRSPTPFFDLVEGTMRVWPYIAITFLCNYFYDIGDQMAESKVAIDKYYEGNTDLLLHMWILKIAARDLLASCAVAFGW